MEEHNRYLNYVIDEIEKAKRRNGKGVYLVSAKITDAVADSIRQYFNGKSEYELELRKCMSCKHSWDITILFKNTP